MQHKWLPTVGVIFFLLALAFGVLLKPYIFKADDIDSFHLEVLHAYEAKNVDQAKQLLIAHGWEKILPRQEGCELVISVFAEGADWARLEKASRWCLDHSLAQGLAQEGIGKSLVEQKRGDEAAKILTEALKGASSQPPEIRQRIKDALAHVYLLTGQPAKSKEILFQK